MGVHVNACSLSQLRRLGREVPGTSIGVRFNPGLGSGGTKSTNVGGPSSSFGAYDRQPLGSLTVDFDCVDSVDSQTARAVLCPDRSLIISSSVYGDICDAHLAESLSCVYILDFSCFCSLHGTRGSSQRLVRFDIAGVWHEWADKVKELCEEGGLTVSRIHTHIGSGSDPAVWQKVGHRVRRKCNNFTSCTGLRFHLAGTVVTRGEGAMELTSF